MSNNSTKDARANQEESEVQPNVGTDPMELPQEQEGGTQKEMVTPDPEKMAEHEREEAAHRQHETPPEHAERIKNA
ncbi:MAG: hypothetical protein ACR2GR_03340 [Rhodothermales bacterium]